jgi:hypothetical protein
MEDSKETANKGIIKKFGEFIEKIIDNIKIFINKIINKFKGNKENKELLEKLNEAEKVVKNDDEKIELYDMTNEEKIINEYIKKLITLERKLMAIKVEIKYPFPSLVDSSEGQRAIAQVEYQKVEQELEKINEEYDKKILNKYSNVIELAKKDAIRFSKKQLENVEVDFKNLSKGTEKVLREFKKDANGCKHPVKLNLLQRISNSLAIRSRKYLQKKVTYREHNMGIIMRVVVGITGAITLGGIAVKTINTLKDNKIGKMISDDFNDKKSEKEKSDDETKIKVISKNYKKGKYTDDDLKKLVKRNFITKDNYKIITGKEFV